MELDEVLKDSNNYFTSDKLDYVCDRFVCFQDFKNYNKIVEALIPEYTHLLCLKFNISQEYKDRNFYSFHIGDFYYKENNNIILIHWYIKIKDNKKEDYFLYTLMNKEIYLSQDKLYNHELCRKRML